ncbi:MAG TPA: HEAT repeat domain-containing protein [Tepidisphaeraceae bacterium]|jgi:HEAT repeat protein|nr:HEAT repeat domain-containing protein [Tepidisphaeraceae bacterium]
MGLNWNKSAAGNFSPVCVVGCVFCLMLLARPALAAEGEAAQRETFAKQYKDKDPQKRVEAVKSLKGVSEGKSISLLAGALKDAVPLVRRAAAETLQSVSDGGGVAVKPLCTLLENKGEQPPIRLAAARALAKGPYKADAIKSLIVAISLEESDVLLYAFGEDCTMILDKVAGQDFGVDKDTPGKWKSWWKDNQAKVIEQDRQTLAAYKKSGAGK